MIQMRTAGRSCASILALVILAPGCGSETTKAARKADAAEKPTQSKDQRVDRADRPVRESGACDPVDPAACLLPWPNDRFTRSDSSTPTGIRMDLPEDGMPSNAAGTPIDPTEWNRSDGFSPASTLITRVPGVDAAKSALPPITDIGTSLESDSNLVLIDVDTGERIAAWAELDANAQDESDRNLLIVPAVGLADGHRYAVALRGLVTAADAPIEPNAEMTDALAAAENATWVESLESAGVARDEIVVAWSFTIASTESLTGRLGHMWEETAAALGEGAPEVTITDSETSGPVRVVNGSFPVPNYLQGDGGPGSVFNNDDDPNGIPTRNGERIADFTCTIPAAATEEDPAYMMAYGHGLLGSRSEVLGIGSFAALANVGLCALDFIGMSTADVPTVLSQLEELTRFRTQADRLQQGHLAFLVLGRLLRSEEGFVSNAAFQSDAGTPLFDNSQAGFLGASQGGILGGVPSAFTKDWDKVVLGVGGMGYNTLLFRSIDFDKFAPVLDQHYPDELEQPLILDLMEQLWVRGENAGYASHVTRDPLGGSDPKQVLLLQAFGDHQVANVATEKLARTMGLSLKSPSLEPGRSTDEEPQWGIPPIPNYPFEGSALIVWDFGSPAPPVENLPPREGDDPHGKLGDEPAALALLIPFVEEGILDNPCGGKACVSN